MDRSTVLAMQNRFAALNAFELAERRSATPAMRMDQLDAIWRLAAELGIQNEVSNDVAPRDQWMKLRKAIDERSRIHSE